MQSCLQEQIAPVSKAKELNTCKLAHQIAEKDRKCISQKRIHGCVSETARLQAGTEVHAESTKLTAKTGSPMKSTGGFIAVFTKM